MLGVLCIFDDYYRVLKNVLSWLNPKGRLILHNMVNEYDIDVFVKYRKSNENYVESDLESGWNIISKRSLELFAEKNNARLVSCEDFSISVDLKELNDFIDDHKLNDVNNNIYYQVSHINELIKNKKFGI